MRSGLGGGRQVDDRRLGRPAPEFEGGRAGSCHQRTRHRRATARPLLRLAPPRPVPSLPPVHPTAQPLNPLFPPGSAGGGGLLSTVVTDATTRRRPREGGASASRRPAAAAGCPRDACQRQGGGRGGFVPSPPTTDTRTRGCARNEPRDRSASVHPRGRTDAPAASPLVPGHSSEWVSIRRRPTAVVIHWVGARAPLGGGPAWAGEWRPSSLASWSGAILPVADTRTGWIPSQVD